VLASQLISDHCEGRSCVGVQSCEKGLCGGAVPRDDTMTAVYVVAGTAVLCIPVPSSGSSELAS